MKKKIYIALCLVLVGALAVAQIKEAIKIIGVGAAVKQFGPDINKQFNKLTKHTDTPDMSTKVVPIISVGIGAGSGGSAVGAAQVSGPKDKIDKVAAVAQPEAKIFGEIRIRALIPVSSKNVIENIKKVDGVGVTGIVDLKL